MLIRLNDQVLRAEDARIPVYDHGLLYGLGLFETFRTYNGIPFLLEDHLKRLGDGCTELGIQANLQPATVTAWVQELLEANQLSEAYVRLTVTAGSADLGLPTGDYTTPTIILMVKPLPAFDTTIWQKGKELRLLSTYRNTPEGDVRYKSLHYMNNILGKRELMAAVAGGEVGATAEGLMITRQGHLAEGIVSNLFFACSNVLYTPAVETGILPGITRAHVMRLAQNSGYTVCEGLYAWEELLQADEVFLTNSIMAIVPVTYLSAPNKSAVQVGAGRAGQLTCYLHQRYR